MTDPVLILGNGSTLASVALAILVLVVLSGGVLALRRERAARASLEHRLEVLERDHRAGCGAQARVGDRLLAVEHQVRGLNQGQTQLEMKAPATESYRHAISLVEHGASSDDLISNCGLARGEAELMHLIHAATRSASEAA